MPVPLAPIAWTALRAGAVVAVAVIAARKHRQSPQHIWRNAALDDAPDGVEFGSDTSGSRPTGHASARFRRSVRFGQTGPGIELDIGALGRVRFRRI
jgi:hypothetical protein